MHETREQSTRWPQGRRWIGMIAVLIALAGQPAAVMAQVSEKVPGRRQPIAAPATSSAKGQRAPNTAAPTVVRSEPVVARGGLVVSVEPNASRIGAEIMRDGGNAIDAAVATALALAVTHPEAGNIGGGGFALVRLARTGEAFVIDFRETAPALASPTMFLGPKGLPDPAKVDVGWLTVGVPGSPAGLKLLHEKGGRLPWKQVVEPAVRLATEGFIVDPYLAEGLAGEEKVFQKFGEPARVYFGAAGRPPRVGETLKLPELGRSLARLRDQGMAGFYEGETAELLERAMIANGGLLRRSDLKAYRAKVREPVRGSYRGQEILGASPPSGGGTLLVTMLNILEGYDLRADGPNHPRTIHRLAEAMRRAYLDRARFLGDPDFGPVPVERMTSKTNANELRRSIGERASSSLELGKGLLTHTSDGPVESDQTTHFSIVDGEGNAVALTTTLEDSYGARVIAPGTGFLLNNEMHDFNVTPGRTDDTGRVGTPPNNIAPGKRMLSSQCPVIVVKDGKTRLVTGSPGGRTIPNTVLRIVTGVIDFGLGVREAVELGRVHHQWMPDRISLEYRLEQSLVEEMTSRGHTVTRRVRQGDGHSILVDPNDGSLRPGTDRRLRGSAYGF